MKKKFLLFSIGVVSILSCAAAMSLAPNDKIAKATNPIDLGEVNFTLDTGASQLVCETGVYLFSDVQNSLPYDWSNRLYPTGTGSAIYNGNDMYSASEYRIHICKFNAEYYYIAFSDYPSYYASSRSEGDTITVKGDWLSTMQGNDYILHINEFTAVWSDGRWKQEFIVPELEAYDRISLAQIAADDFDQVIIDTENVTTGWNSFAVSPENTTNSFAFEFAYESYSALDRTLAIRFGASEPWEADHYLMLNLNNKWGPKGVITFNEIKKVNGNPTIIHKPGDIEVDLQPGARHIIECGSIVVKNTNNFYNYVKYDGEYMLQEVFTPDTLARTTRVGMYYNTTNIFVGGTIDQKENTDVMTFNRSDADKGVYFFGPENDIPVLDNWRSKGVPASKYNMLKNGEKFYQFTPASGMPLTKHQSNEYYFSFADFGVTFVKGDVMTIAGEFHFRVNDKTYVMAIVPINLEFNGSVFEPIENIDEYFIQTLHDYVDLDCYDADQQAVITNIIQNAQSSITSAVSMRDKWAAFNEAKASLDAVPMNPDKLEEYKQAAIRQVNALLDETKYEPEQLAIIQGYVDDAIIAINAATNVKAIRDIVEETKELVKGVATKQDLIEQRIMALEEGYEQYLDANEVITTSDICAVGNLNFYPLDDTEHESYSSYTGPNSVYSRFATKPENEFGNVVMKFRYESTNPSSNKYGSQVYIRMRGTAASCYIFDIAKDISGNVGVSLAKFEQDIKFNEQEAKYDFAANTEYEIECGAIDITGFDRTFLFMKINGEFILKTIVDRHELSILAPTVLIMDSHTKDGSGESVSLKPIEIGTTKSDVATSIGRPILDASASSESLKVKFRNNTLPVGAKLYPMEFGAYAYNGREVDNTHAPAVITKTSETQYSISLLGMNIQDSDNIHIGGCFAYYDEDTNVKTVFKITNRVFTYHASSSSWSQSAPSLDEVKQEAIDYLNGYVNLADYSEQNQRVVQALLDEYIERITNATSSDEVEFLLESAIAEINAVPTLLIEYKARAKEELTAYKSPSIYRDEEKAELNSILANAFSRIDACNDTDSVDYIVATTKQQIDTLKTAAEYEAEELASAKRLAKTEIETYIGLVELDRYTDENVAKIQQLAMKARNDVDSATSIDEVRNIVASFKEDIKNVSTKDGSIFDGEKYVEPNQKKKGCGGEIISAAIIVPVLSLVALVLLICLRKKYILSK